MLTLTPVEMIWVRAANTLSRAERTEALEDIADMARISLPQVRQWADSIRLLGGNGSAILANKAVMVPERSQLRTARPQRVAAGVFEPTMKRLMAGK